MRSATDPADDGTHEAAIALHDQADRMAAAGQLDEAAELYERALTAKRNALGPAHPEVAITLHNLALLCHAAGRTEQARSLWAEADAVIAASFDEDDGTAQAGRAC